MEREARNDGGLLHRAVPAKQAGSFIMKYIGGFYCMEERAAEKAHKLVLANRRMGSFSGIVDVLSFDISEILLETELAFAYQGSRPSCESPEPGKG